MIQSHITFKLPPSIKLPSFETQAILELAGTSNLCDECGVELRRVDDQYQGCPTCGVEFRSQSDRVVITNEIIHSYNSGCNTHTPIRIVGKGPNIHQRSNKLFGAVTDSAMLREQNILSKLEKRWHQIPGDQDNVPRAVLKEVARQYCTLEKDGSKLVKRSGGLWSVLSHLLYEECKNYGTPRKPHAISNFTEIDSHKLSDGRTILQDCGVIISQVAPSVESFIDQYLDNLGLVEHSEKYREFLIQLVKKTDNNVIITNNNTAKPTTRCAGVIMILCQQMKLGVSSDDIANACSISKGTVERFVKFVTGQMKKGEPHAKKIRKLFKEYEVPYLGK